MIDVERMYIIHGLGTVVCRLDKYTPSMISFTPSAQHESYLEADHAVERHMQLWILYPSQEAGSFLEIKFQGSAWHISVRPQSHGFIATQAECFLMLV